MAKNIKTIGLIGAGIAGLSCARKLHDSGINVTLFEKSKGLGGRVATRRLDSGITFDHGAQYFTAYDDVFANRVKQWCDERIVSQWQGQIVSLDRGIVSHLTGSRDRFVGVPGMNAIAKSLAIGIKTEINTTIQRIGSQNQKWQLEDSNGALHGPYDGIISSAPPLQTLSLFGDVEPSFLEVIPSVVMQPCWALILQFAEVIQLPFDAAFIHNSPLSWIARNSSKPERPSSNSWVLHASAKWSEEHLEESSDEITKKLTECFWQATRLKETPILFAASHRWRYALPDQPLSQRCLFDHDKKLGACGDWCGGPRVEGAYLSGLAMAEMILESR